VIDGTAGKSLKEGAADGAGFVAQTADHGRLRATRRIRFGSPIGQPRRVVKLVNFDALAP
jgi:hypothetical protein